MGRWPAQILQRNALVASQNGLATGQRIPRRIRSEGQATALTPQGLTSTPTNVCTRVCTDDRQSVRAERVEELAAEILELTNEEWQQYKEKYPNAAKYLEEALAI